MRPDRRFRVPDSCDGNAGDRLQIGEFCASWAERAEVLLRYLTSTVSASEKDRSPAHEARCKSAATFPRPTHEYNRLQRLIIGQCVLEFLHHVRSGPPAPDSSQEGS